MMAFLAEGGFKRAKGGRLLTVLIGVNPREYLLDTLSQLPTLTADQAREITPAKRAAAGRSKAA